jgi:hypothetical protein
MERESPLTRLGEHDAVGGADDAVGSEHLTAPALAFSERAVPEPTQPSTEGHEVPASKPAAEGKKFKRITPMADQPNTPPLPRANYAALGVTIMKARESEQKS